MSDFVLTSHLARAVTRELPNNIPYIVKKGFIGIAVKKWDSPSKKLFDVTKNELQKRVKEVIEDQFSQYTHGGLKQRVMCVFQCPSCFPR
jgi:hypothetical protein